MIPAAPRVEAEDDVVPIAPEDLEGDADGDIEPVVNPNEVEGVEIVGHAVVEPNNPDRITVDIFLIVVDGC